MKKIMLFMMLLVAAISPSFAWWYPIPSPVKKQLLSISFGSATTGYIGGADSTLLKTTDGGKTWTIFSHKGLTFSATTPDIIDVNFVSATTGYAIVANHAIPLYTGSVFKTTNGGLNWVISTDVNIAGRKTFFFDEHNGFQVGSAFFSGCNVSKMVAGKWQDPVPLHHSPDSFLYALDFFDTNTGIIGGDNGKVHRTFDGGITWDTVQTNSHQRINELKYLDANNIIGVADDAISVMISKNKGLSWEWESHSATFDHPHMRALARSKHDSLIAVGSSNATGRGLIFVYGRATFHPYIFFALQKLNDVGMANDSLAYVVGDSGVIGTNYLESSGINTVTTSRNILEIFPNPAHDVLYFTTGNSGSTFQVSVFDIMGRIVLQDNVAAQKLNIPMLAPGTYLLQLNAEGYTATRQFMKE